MAFKLHGSTGSTCTRRVALIAKERNIPYEFIPVNMSVAEHKQPPHLQHQPFGQVPFIVQEDGFELFESRAIGRYLTTFGSGPQLIPTEPKAYAKFEQAAGIEYAQFDPIAAGITVEKIFKPRYGQATNEKHLEGLIAQFESKLNGYEAILGKQKYLAGDEVTLADLYHLPYGKWVFVDLGLGDLDKRPNLKRPSWQAVKDGV